MSKLRKESDDILGYAKKVDTHAHFQGQIIRIFDS